MASAAELREEAARLRSVLGRVTNPEELAQIQAMIDELEGRAKETDNGDASDGACAPADGNSLADEYLTAR